MEDRKLLAEVERAAADRRRSDLFWWMYRHHEAFAEKLRRAGRPNWKALAVAFTAAGLMRAEQKHEVARYTWTAVRKALKRDAEAEQRASQSAAQPREKFSFRGDSFPAGEDDFSDIERIK